MSTLRSMTVVCALALLATCVCGVYAVEHVTTSGGDAAAMYPTLESLNAESRASGLKNAFISAVLTDHKKIESLAARLREHEVSNAEKAETAKTVIGILLLHDRRERMTLYALAAVLMSDEMSAQMLNEHNLMLVSLLKLNTADFTNTTVLHNLNSMLDDVLKHLDDEERTLLPLLGTFLNKRPKLTTALLNKWTSLTSTKVPLVTELVAAEHIKLQVLTTAMRLIARAARMEPENELLIKLRNKVARTLVNSLNEHSLCESAVFYPLVNKVLGGGLTTKLMNDHNQLDELVAKLKASPTIDYKFAKTMIKAIKLEKQHMAHERQLMTKLVSYLESNVEENEDLVTGFAKCQMMHDI